MELALSLGDNNKNKEDPGRPLQLDLLPFSPVPRNHSHHLSLPWLLPDHFDASGRKRLGLGSTMEGEVDGEDGAAMSSSPNNSGGSNSFNIMIGGGGRKRELVETEVDQMKGSLMSDEDDNGLTRKKLRLSKDQSVFLEESFKEHNTLNPKQKLALAKQLNLRPRQVEVWFQNRRARTKLKQTEVDCEYLKRCCETLTEENRRLQKELQELRTLKTSQPFFMQLPATTLTMCPSCERTSTAGNPRLFPFKSHKAAS
ncbi:homeobox-leucine zipper protein HOX11-like [Impatiens glandulifera]|uniref:homeobox-leucine zipper protein HOX11-like n=1 Tax=Impatiens glandulifera TaxID=253017 RepID=UPI001FB11E80|nr:homeobox-leucine zipper protein HOX11-like [Impatiens glandulifera]